MAFMFSKIMDASVDAHFRKDLGGRLVFIPFNHKGKRYFVDSKSDEEKLRALVKMYRSATVLISLMVYPVIYIPGLVLDVFGGMTPRSHRLSIAVGIPSFFGLLLIGLMLMQWILYKRAVPAFTRSLSEVGPDLQLQEPAASARQQRIALACVGILLLLLGFIVFAVQHRRTPCPTRPHCQQLELDSPAQAHLQE